VRRVSSWRRLLDIGSDPADDADLAVRKRTAVGTLSALLVVGVVYLVIGLATNRPLVSAFAIIQATRPVTRSPTRTRADRSGHESKCKGPPGCVARHSHSKRPGGPSCPLA